MMIGEDDPFKPTISQQHLRACLMNACVDIVTPNKLASCKNT